MEQLVPEKGKISPFLVFFLLHTMQVGIGVLGFQRIIAKYAGYDAWISVLVTGLSIHIILWMMYKIGETTNGDMLSAHTFVFGKKLGKILTFPFIFYFTLVAVTILRTFIEVIQVWMFPDLNTFWYSLAYCILAIYIIFGGFRTVAGIAFFGVILPLYLNFIFLFTLPYTDFKNLLPIFDHSVKDLLMSGYKMSLTYLGYEILLFLYPYIKDPQRSKKWAHLGILYTTFLYTLITIITFAYFSEGQLQKHVWPTLTMWKAVHMPFVERFEYIGIANWNIIILPNFCIALWCASRLLKRVVHLKQKKGILLISFACLIAINFFKTREQINKLGDYTGLIAFFLNFGYIPFLFCLVLLVKKVKKK
ncbi:GerAB/ArcD/ProY family transporter [Neobacillus thermocopriae]|uniref:GerAB/ArcD/ProY family transporter n=1 Tax=Neobacillus thermocopriae TaxID=1215031 RepID=A0A6B3TRX5_9BACI|nr:GerAB/ArcD/ProY family transporter [Neobacillus thermocopriae]MED3623377.1 GerAB/ArcD/ProY family transporter [Neobacillus thermocopriae]MED3713956.1 GerAB/ArcD/ProY family transporter [Neobacillus thermocopriae]NEX79338.1 GerAB/ArcD/ProY family transporter [Neobacillus thermocopriae]